MNLWRMEERRIQRRERKEGKTERKKERQKAALVPEWNFLLRRAIKCVLAGTFGQKFQGDKAAKLGVLGLAFPGQTISHYRILEKLGGGGMGVFTAGIGQVNETRKFSKLLRF